MLARLPKAADMDFAKLKIPPKPAAITDAERDWRAAVAEREAAQAKHREAHRIYHSQRPGEPPVITAAQVDQAGQEIEPCLKREREALQLLERHRAAFDADLASLGPRIDAYRNAISEKIDELEDLLGLGVLLHAAAVQANVKLPRKLPGRCQGIMEHGIHMTRKLVGSD
ncbi:hypothetical protein ACWGTI_03405 [Mesorhizobium sp. ArgA1]